ncbi:hypothetical protein KA183_14935 [bacterium]|nr:hypothetical protein [bacterium]
MSDELEINELTKPPKMADKLTRAENISTTEQNHDYAQALASNPDQFPSIANLRIPNADQIEPFQLVDGTKSLAASRKIEQPTIRALDSFNQGLLALPEGTTPEQLAQFQIDYINRKAAESDGGTMPAIKLEGRVEKTQTDNEEYFERMAGFLIGSVQGTGNVAVGLAQIADFAAYCIIGDTKRAGEMVHQFSDGLTKTLAGGVRLFQSSYDYLYELGYEGDYKKPFKDISELAVSIDEQWKQLSPREQERRKAELVSQLIADGFLGFASAQSLKKTEKLTEFFDSIADVAGKTKIKSKEAFAKATKAISNTVDDLLSPVADTGTGIRMKVPKADDLALKMEDQSNSRAYRGDNNVKSKFNENGRPKSHINEQGDLVPANIIGVFNGKPVDVVDHVCPHLYNDAKSCSPFISLSVKESVAIRFGNEKITVDLDALRDAVNKGEIIGTEIIEHADLLELVKQSQRTEHQKNIALYTIKMEHEMLVKGIIPARYLGITK